MTTAPINYRRALDFDMPVIEIPSEYHGWWRIIETSQWDDSGLDVIGAALLSITGRVDRLRMHVLLAYVNWKVNTASLSFTWNGSWEFDEMSGTGSFDCSRTTRSTGSSRSRTAIVLRSSQNARTRLRLRSRIRRAGATSGSREGDGGRVPAWRRSG